MDELLVRVFAAALRWNGRNGTLDQFEQGLLYAFAGYVARDRRVLAFTCDFVDLIDVDDAFLRFFFFLMEGW